MGKHNIPYLEEMRCSGLELREHVGAGRLTMKRNTGKILCGHFFFSIFGLNVSLPPCSHY